MSLKWTNSNSESGILRKSDFKEKKEELFVFGYSCKLFRDDEKALQIDQGKHLIPWMGDETLKIDRYDARGALHDLTAHEAPPGGFDWRIELTKNELDVEQLCDEERYRALHTDEDEEEMYKEEELKRLHAAGYGQVGFNYDTPAQPEVPVQPAEVEEPFVPAANYKALFGPEIVFPESDKQNVIIDKTAKFIASQGAQMEILIKAKQGDNPQFKFLNRDSPLHAYYSTLIALIKAGKWPEKKPEIIEERPHENEDYLHPSLASTIIESAPSIPSIHYKPSADCDYTMLISKMRGTAPPEETYSSELAPGEVAPPGTEPLPPRHQAEISRPPVMYARPEDPTAAPEAQTQYTQAQYQQYMAYYQQYQPQAQPAPAPVTQPKADVKPTPLKSTGLSLMKNYNTDSDSDVSDCDDTSSTDSKDKTIVISPPEEVQIVIDKMADYVSRNGAEFADIVRAKGDPRFSFLEPTNVHHAYYCSRLEQIRRGDSGQPKKRTAPVSFSIKKLKEPEPILPKPALPYESSSDEEADKDKQNNKQSDKDESKNNSPVVKPNFPIANNIPPTVVYKMEGTQENNLPIVKTIETIKPKTIIPHVVAEPKLYKEDKKLEDKPVAKVEEPKLKEIRKSVTPDVDRKRKENPRVDKKEKDLKKDKEYKEKARSPERKKTPAERKKSPERKRSPEKDKKRDIREKRTEKKNPKEDLESEIISLEDNSDEMIDLTEDHSDGKEGDSESARAKQLSRRRRAAEFLKRVGVDPVAASALPTSSLASAMVDTLESLRKKKAEAEEKRRKREKRRHREKYGYEDETDKSHRKSKRRKYKSTDEEDSDYDNSKRKRRKKDKKGTKNKKKRKRESVEEEEEEEQGPEQDHPLPPNIDLMTTLKELRTKSPTKELVLQDIEETHSLQRESSEEDEVEIRRGKKKEKREYSEGEWSSDTEGDSLSSHSKVEE